MRKRRVNGDRQTAVSSSDHCTCSDGQKIFFCNRCRQIICEYCKSTIHKYHECLPIDEAATEVRNDIQKLNPAEKTKGKMESVLNAQQIIQSMKTDLNALEVDKIREIDLRLDELHKELIKIRTNLVETILDAVKRESGNLNKAEKMLNKTAKSITDLCDAAKKLIDEQNNFVVVNDGYSICEDIDEILKTDLLIPETALSVEFYPGTTDHASLLTMFGKISIQSKSLKSGNALEKLAKGSEPSSKVTTASQLPETLVTCASGGAESRIAEITCLSDFGVDSVACNVASTADDMCWYGGWDSNDIKLVDRMGEVVNRHTLSDFCTGLTTLHDGTVYISCYDKSLMKLSINDTMAYVKKGLTFRPDGLTCLPDTGELLVCGGEDGVFSVTRRKVKPAMTGIKFGWAWDIAVNDSGDVCVSDIKQEKCFIFNSHKHHVATYAGPADMTGTMSPRGVTCDGRGGFIVSDSSAKKLHVINRDGDNVGVYNTRTNSGGKPQKLDMSQSGRLWVGFKNKHICVYNTT